MLEKKINKTAGGRFSAIKSKTIQIVEKHFKVRNIIIVMVLLLVVLGGLAGYFYKQLYEAKSNPQKISDAEVDSLIAKISKLIVLPEGERPTVATVTDPDKLKDQAFFANAKKGYKVLIYTNAKKAILYNPFENRLVEVAPIGIGNQPK